MLLASRSRCLRIVNDYLLVFFFIAAVKANDDDDGGVDVDGTIEEDLGKSRDGSRTDDEVVQRWVLVEVGTARPSL